MIHGVETLGRAMIGGLMLPLLLAAVLSGCGTATERGHNADEFRERVTQAGYEVVLLPEREGRPDLVEGVVTSKDGVSKRFAFAFGPAPQRKLPAPADDTEAVWFSAGDEVYYWVDYDYLGTKKELNGLYDAEFAVEDTACEVVADKDCGF